ncbi:hypothetical protein Thein_0394 [Thermodesulfatator indicus DSM 15286]|uniref:Uncharacterized protein n=1 Tax=Thermodesulfatator indicus (strain DSM 15286 / JCM 11887 / CIR29812) TaxID=667014 RepID=F8AAK4_THEID|nr:hypothetical protein [Thermodesulfatator indicus]AEH44276.1 hypothetical protein Thein_0394 [Thermodesulfatator indicus DSM 15286]
MKPKAPLILCFLFAFLCSSSLVVASVNTSPDEENCAICHRYPGLAYIDQKTGKMRLFYVNPKLYAQSVHGEILCRYCHIGLDVIPHNNVKKVNCANKCHIKEPSTNKEFSHEPICARLKEGVHWPGEPPNLKKYPEDYPKCSECHVNQIYKPVVDLRTLKPGINPEVLRRCLGCHPQEKWTKRFYQHFAHRMHRAKTPKELVDLCLACHADANMMARHGLEPVSGYKDTFHWKAVLYNDPNAPDCISCHAPPRFKRDIHNMLSVKDPNSPLAPANRPLTCASPDGIIQCHPGATEKFASGKIHKVPIGLTGDPLKELKAKSKITASDVKEEELSPQELMQRKIYYWVKVLYTLLITFVIGGMMLHQMMDFYRTIRRKDHH